MKFHSFLKDKMYVFLISFIEFGILFLMFMAFKIDKTLIIASFVLLILGGVLLLFMDFFRKRRFYTELLINTENLDKAYLVLETLKEPSFYEGRLFYQIFYEINKSFLENVNALHKQNKDFKEYVEMWIHEVKIPLSTLLLIINNHKEDKTGKIKSQIKRLEDSIEQVLYYVRSENAEKDYLIKEVNIMDVVKNIGLKNMDELLENKIEFKVQIGPIFVLSDSKWLEFIVGQIVNNAIKYKRDIQNSYIKITTRLEKNTVLLMIEDNGIGIKQTDIKQVFNKSFTGENGRIRNKSTGMGLFIAKNMCEKLGHKITIESSYHNYTRVYITFSKNEFYDPVQ